MVCFTGQYTTLATHCHNVYLGFRSEHIKLIECCFLVVVVVSFLQFQSIPPMYRESKITPPFVTFWLRDLSHSKGWIPVALHLQSVTGELVSNDITPCSIHLPNSSLILTSSLLLLPSLFVSLQTTTSLSRSPPSLPGFPEQHRSFSASGQSLAGGVPHPSQPGSRACWRTDPTTPRSGRKSPQGHTLLFFLSLSP